MAWPNPFYRTTPNTINHYGYVFEWTDDHLTDEQCRPFRHSYDEVADRALDRLNEISPPQKTQLPRNSAREESIAEADKKESTESSRNSSHPDEKPKPPPRDLFALLRDNRHNDPVLTEFWEQITYIPEWVDWDQIARGQDVFYRYGGANLTGLAYQSLLGGMGAARVVETLARTGGFSVKVARGRLFETTQHILQCTKSLASIQPPDGEGFASTVRVRLLHAAVRKRILALAATRPDYYDVSKFGIPINDLDCAATISTFSATLIWLSLPRQGIFMRPSEITDYIALWRYIAHVIGAPTSYFATPEKAKAIMQTLYYHEIKPSKTSAIMANNIIRCLADQPPGHASADFLIASARWLNGPALSDALQLPRVSPYYTLLMAGQCLFFAFFSYTYRSVPSWDRKKIELLRKVFWQIVVESKFSLQGKQTVFDFKYVPEYETVTEMGEQTAVGDKGASVERRNLKAFGVGVMVMLGGAWVGWKVVRGLWGLVL
ncbi:hypothetical protein BDZ85DRAFT_302337 [Elsinoe ampelina]|uniref:ER-bound oxygenase mpaB/mpaB'/Rubber oxygenase catalytic domain-containing protein n=1 Tax=Elsinoe ampelina TaxID=302913 RepID=A0A6A6G6P5_9PEZI|nr:hypothetical protein BDZ85DRAFT_302337 [Elsinoe ampelina]